MLLTIVLLTTVPLTIVLLATGARDRDWRVVASGVFLLLVLAALVEQPFMNAATVQHAHAYMPQLAEPARAAV